MFLQMRKGIQIPWMDLDEMACTGYLQQSPNVLIRQAVFKFACLKIDF